MTDVPPDKRNIGIVFQDYALYPHFTIKKNILSFFLFKKKDEFLDEKIKEKLKQTSELLDINLKFLVYRLPSSLSEGEKQRVAIGRCITRDPSLFLMDEPFSNLDASLKEKYRVHLKNLINKFEVTTILATNEQREAILFSDLVVVINNGKVEQVGTYREIYDNPVNLFVAGFLNYSSEIPSLNILPGNFISMDYKDYIVGIRPEDVEINFVKEDDSFEGVIEQLIENPLTHHLIIKIKINSKEIFCVTDLEKKLELFSPIYFKFKKIFKFDKNTEKRVE